MPYLWEQDSLFHPSVSAAMIHPTALISPHATLAADVEVGPYAIIEDAVQVGAGCRILGHAQLLAGVILGENNLVDRGAILGGDPQSLQFDRRTLSGVRVGNHNHFREFVTVHRSTHPGGETRIGDGNFFMAGSHVGHDAGIGNDNVIANAVLLAGHVTLGNRCFLGGGSVYHQFIRVGDLAMSQGNSSFSSDIPPYCIGHEVNLLAGLNVIGLRRAGVDSRSRLELKRVYRGVYQHPLGPVKAAAILLESVDTPEAAAFLKFLATPGPKGLSTPGSR